MIQTSDPQIRHLAGQSQSLIALIYTEKVRAQYVCVYLHFVQRLATYSVFVLVRRKQLALAPRSESSESEICRCAGACSTCLFQLVCYGCVLRRHLHFTGESTSKPSS
jgi:hypothetical protein